MRKITDRSALDPRHIPTVVFQREKETRKTQFRVSVRHCSPLPNIFSSHIGRGSSHHGGPWTWR